MISIHYRACTRWAHARVALTVPFLSLTLRGSEAHGFSSMTKQTRRRAAEGTGPDAGAAAGHRHERLTRVLHEELDALLRDELDDPRLDGVKVTYVELSVDYKNARVGFVGPRNAVHDGGCAPKPPLRADDGPRREALLRALTGATPFLRARLAESVELKVLPALRFLWDALAAAAPEPEVGTPTRDDPTQDDPAQDD
jgi:ribosome-binding factor A